LTIEISPGTSPAACTTRISADLTRVCRYDAAATRYNYFRDYDPASGRYVESDPIGLRAGISLSRGIELCDEHGDDYYRKSLYFMLADALVRAG